MFVEVCRKKQKSPYDDGQKLFLSDKVHAFMSIHKIIIVGGT